MEYTENLALDKPNEFSFDWEDSWYKNQTIIDLTINQMLKDNWTLSGGALTVSSGLALSLVESSFSIGGENFAVTAETVNITPAGVGLINITFAYVDDTGDVIQSTTPPTGNYALVAVVLNDDTGIISITNLNRYKYSVSGYKENQIIDGDFNLWFEGDTQTTVSGYGSDTMFANVFVNTTRTHSRQEFIIGQTDVPENPKYFSRTAVASSFIDNAYCRKEFKCENVFKFSGRKVTFSFWAKANAVKNIAIEPRYNFGTGGTPSSIIFATPQKISITTTWEKYVFIIDVPDLSGKTIGTDNNDYFCISIWFESSGELFNARTDNLGNQSGTFDISKVRLVFGSEPAGEELLDPIETGLKVDTVYSKGQYLLEIGTTGTSYFSDRIPLKSNLIRTNPTVLYYDFGGTVSKITEKRGSNNTHGVTPSTTVPMFATSNGTQYVVYTHRNTTSAISGVAFRFTLDCRL